MTESFKVAAAQLDTREPHRRAALAALTAHIASTAPDAVVLPEMPFSPWLAADRVGDPVADSRRWQHSVAEHDAAVRRLADLGAPAVVASRPTQARRNEAFTWTAATGAVGLREKYYLPDEAGFWEASWYDRGELRLGSARAGAARVGILLCTELWFFECARHYARSGVELLCIPRVTPFDSLDRWLAAGRAAAVCAGAYCVSSNQWVPSGSGVEAGGAGWVMSPDGDVLAVTTDDEPFVTVEIDLDVARAAKQTYPRYVRE